MRRLCRSLRAFGAAAILASARPASADTPVESKTAPRAFPVAFGNTDQGVGFGGIAMLAREEPGYRPFKWRIEVQGVASFSTAGGTPRLQYQDYRVDVVVPQILPGLRLEWRPIEYADEVLWWYGVGNASEFEPTWEAIDPETNRDAWIAARRFWQYERKHISSRVILRQRIYGNLHFQLGQMIVLNETRATDESLVRRDAKNPNLRVLGLENHAVYVVETGLVYDDRDDEVDPRSGMWHKVAARISPAGSAPFRYGYRGANVTVRFYHSPSEAITLGARIVGDVLTGDVPFWELPRYDDHYAIGGTYGVRGVPAQRYAGRAKLFGNFEVRARLAKLDIFGGKFKLGVAAFFDAGRVWSELRARPELDGRSLGLRWGVGGGLRLGWGESLMVRGDVAWSPDARPIGVYFASGHVF